MSDLIKVTDNKTPTGGTLSKLMQKLFPQKDLNSSVDTRAYIDLDQVKDINEKLGKLYEQFNNFKSKAAGKSEDEILTTFLKDLKKYKRISVLKNIGACIGALGVVCPAIMLALRFYNKDNREFKVKAQLEEQLAKDIKSGKIKV